MGYLVLFTVLMLMPLRWGSAGLPDVIDKVAVSVVAVGTYWKTRRPPAKFLGTGFIVHNGQYVITNAHVVPASSKIEDKEDFVVFIGKGQDLSFRRVLRTELDTDHDLAALKIEGRPLPRLKVGDSQRVRHGQEYVFTGYPIGPVLGIYPVTHRALISSISPIVLPTNSGQSLTAAMVQRLRNPFDIFQLDATAYPGNSGSPVYDPETGTVIAVINMVLAKDTKESELPRASGITYAVPIQYAVQLLQKMRH